MTTKQRPERRYFDGEELRRAAADGSLPMLVASHLDFFVPPGTPQDLWDSVSQLQVALRTGKPCGQWGQAGTGMIICTRPRGGRH